MDKKAKLKQISEHEESLISQCAELDEKRRAVVALRGL